MGRENLEKIAQTPQERMFLGKLWDRIDGGLRREIPVNTGFLSPREQEMAQYLFGSQPGLTFFGGYPQAERRMLWYVPAYEADRAPCPIRCLRAEYFRGDRLTHRDFLGALMGAGVAREAVGDILVGEGSCDFFATREVTPWLLQEFAWAGRTRLKLTEIPLEEARVPEPKIQVLRETLASLRLDCVVSAGFRVSRTLAVQEILAGRAAVEGVLCQKPDRILEPGMQVSLRGRGKLRLESVQGQTKKGRLGVTIWRYL